MIKHVAILLNGAPTSGKDTLIDYVREAHRIGFRIAQISSIDCIRSLLSISETDKRPETRNVLSKVGAALEEYNQYRSKSVVAKIDSIIAQDSVEYADRPFIFFIPARERYMIDRISDKLRKLQKKSVVHDYEFEVVPRSVYIQRNVDKELKNASASDAEAMNEDMGYYDYCLNNDYSIAEYYNTIDGWVKSLKTDVYGEN